MNKKILIALCSMTLFSCSHPETTAPQDTNPLKQKASELVAPVAKKVPFEMTAHGDTRIDNYYWMRDDDRQSPEVIAHLEAENEYTIGVMTPVADIESGLFEELTGRLEKDKSDVPYYKNGYWYYRTFSGDQEYAVRYRKEGSLDAEAELVYDANELAKGHEYFQLRSGEASPDNKMYSFAVDTQGRRGYDIYVYSLEGEKSLLTEIKDTTGNYEWASDSKYIYYMTRDPQTLLGNKVWRHELGTDQSEDELVYEETDTTYYTWLYKSTDRSTIFIAHSHYERSSVSMLDASNPEAQPVRFHPLDNDFEYWVDKKGDSFYIRTNEGAKNYRLMRASIADYTDKTSWEELVPHRDDALIESYDLFDDHFVYVLLERGKTKIFISDINHQQPQLISFNDDIYQAYPYANLEPSNTYVRFHYSSPTTPLSTIDVDLSTLEATVQKQDKVLGGFDSSNYEAEFIYITARDGVQVPVTIVFRKDKFKKDGSNPIYQFGYGSYGITIDPNFVPANISLLDRGFVVAIAHIRGSQKLGRDWYDDGKLGNKKNTFYDFVDVTKGLVAQGYGDKDNVFAYGGSAGGLLMGAVANMEPKLYKGIAAAVPFVDVVTTISDETLPLTSNEWAEWGNPITDKTAYDYMLSYSPYDNVDAKDYPHMLVTAGLHDSQVGYFEASKWVAKLREYSTSDNLILLKTDMDAGHSGASGRFARYESTARRIAFFCSLAKACEK